MYESILKPIFFKFDPEKVHDFVGSIGETLGNFSLGRRLVAAFCRYEHPALQTTVRGIHFANPIGLGAGFDKEVHLTKIMPSVGFGFMEVGAITHLPYEGNSGKRLARLPKDQSLIVYYGLKNEGADAVERKMQSLSVSDFQQAANARAFPIGINIAKTNRADIKGDKSVEDYALTYRQLAQYFSYVTLNISCPNAADGCTFQNPWMLDSLLVAIAKEKKYGPVFLKISSHLTIKEVDDILAVVEKYNKNIQLIDGFVVANLSKRRDILNLRSSAEQLNAIPEGGISGRPMRDLSTNIVRHIYEKTKGKYTLIGLGGVFTAEDAYEKIKAGASLVQMVTGLIYGGPMAVKRINKGLVRLLKQDGYRNISEAVGTEIKDRCGILKPLSAA
ncbi:MAG: quinone-dependent dihydroorotate dehydrogenase [Patescibacteria group bacterium]|nr:quinone-dependent dihydroorotate dehydrogenase [Patescibacteria group bacterium]